MIGGLLLLWLQAGPVAAHEVTLQGDKGEDLVSLKLELDWNVLAGRNGLELSSGNGHTRIHCAELTSYTTLEEASVYLKTVRDMLFQSFEETSQEQVDFEGHPALKLSGRGVARGFKTSFEGLLFRTNDDHLCMIMLEQDIGYETTMPALRDLLRLPGR